MMGGGTACPPTDNCAQGLLVKKKAGREYGPAKRRFTTFRGEHRPAEWEETAERFYLFALICGLWRRMGFQKTSEKRKFLFYFR
jgi:hypothetical protein